MGQRLGHKPAVMHPAALPALNQAAALQHIEMTRNRRRRHVEWHAELRYRARPLRELRDDPSSDRVGKRRENLVKRPAIIGGRNLRFVWTRCWFQMRRLTSRISVVAFVTLQ